MSLQLGIRYDALPHVWERNNAHLQLCSLAVSIRACPGTFQSSGALCLRYLRCEQPWSANHQRHAVLHERRRHCRAGRDAARHRQELVTRPINPASGSLMTSSGMARPCFAAALALSLSAMQGNDIYDIAGGAHSKILRQPPTWNSPTPATTGRRVLRLPHRSSHRDQTVKIPITRRRAWRSTAWACSTKSLPRSSWSRSMWATWPGTRTRSCRSTTTRSAPRWQPVRRCKRHAFDRRWLEARTYPGFGGMNQINQHPHRQLQQLPGWPAPAEPAWAQL